MYRYNQIRESLNDLTWSPLKVLLAVVVVISIGSGAFSIIRAETVTVWILFDALGEVFLAIALFLTEFGLVGWVLGSASIGVLLEIPTIMVLAEWKTPLTDMVFLLALSYLTIRHRNRRARRRRDDVETEMPDVFGQIERLYAEGEYRHAQSILRKFSKLYRNDYRYYWWQGLLHFNAGDVEKAIDSVDAARSLTEESIPALEELRGQAMYSLGAFETASEVFERNIRDGYNVEGSLLNFAASEFCLGNFDRAGEALERYSRMNSRENEAPSAIYLKGLIREVQREIGDAKELYSRSLQRGWKNCQILSRLASLLIESESWEEARSKLYECIELAGKSSREVDDGLRYLNESDASAKRPWLLQRAIDWSRDDRREWANFPTTASAAETNR